ncbi:M23 family metallopeptidase [Parablautia sp. Marseille-Q6255]|uniref:M23 family metallopeptidase n=1 Tax=Parablautia sp. Marseille-Q6255 TaxID=3039593 RepID=UPI0024BC5EDD|nr:M23 family metallopeptidase [Parablautia sp. Marseille-Q6255]
MDKRDFKNFITKRSSIWTLSLCMTGIIVLGGIAAVDSSRRSKEEQKETEIGQVAYLEEEIGDSDDIEESLFPTLDETEDLAQASGNAVSGDKTDAGRKEADTAQLDAQSLTDAGTVQEGGNDATEQDELAAAGTDAAAVSGQADAEAEASEEASSGQIISEQALLDQGIDFSSEEALMWPAAGTILIDYSMDGSVYFPTLNQYKYNPALIIGSETGNQVVASAKGIVESIAIDEETGNTVVLNIGNGYKLTYGQLKEIAVSQGSVVEEGALLGYVSEPTKYYSEEGSNLYFAMTQDGTAVDPILYLE